MNKKIVLMFVFVSFFSNCLPAEQKEAISYKEKINNLYKNSVQYFKNWKENNLDAIPFFLAPAIGVYQWIIRRNPEAIFDEAAEILHAFNKGNFLDESKFERMRWLLEHAIIYTNSSFKDYYPSKETIQRIKLLHKKEAIVYATITSLVIGGLYCHCTRRPIADINKNKEQNEIK